MAVGLPGAALQCSEMVLLGHGAAALAAVEFSSVWDMGQQDAKRLTIGQSKIRV